MATALMDTDNITVVPVDVHNDAKDFDIHDRAPSDGPTTRTGVILQGGQTEQDPRVLRSESEGHNFGHGFY